MKTLLTTIPFTIAGVLLTAVSGFGAPPYSGITSSVGRQVYSVETDGDAIAGGIVIPKSFLPPQSSWFGTLSMHPRPQQDWSGQLVDIVLEETRIAFGSGGGEPVNTPTNTPSPTVLVTPTSGNATLTPTPTSSVKVTPSPTPLPPTATPFPAEKAITVEFQSLSLEVISTNTFESNQTSAAIDSDSFLVDDFNNVWFTKQQREIYLQLPTGKVLLVATVVNLTDRLHVVEQQLALARYRRFDGYDALDFLCIRNVQERTLPARSWKIVTHYRLVGNFEKFSNTTIEGFRNY